MGPLFKPPFELPVSSHGWHWEKGTREAAAAPCGWLEIFGPGGAYLTHHIFIIGEREAQIPDVTIIALRGRKHPRSAFCS